MSHVGKKGSFQEWLRQAIRPERALALGFFLMIVVGTLLMAMPVSSADGESAGLFHSLFTATSAVCVTGLVVVDTAAAWSPFGKGVLLMLIQMGGLGFMVFATLVMVALGRRITLRDRVVIRESMNAATLSGLVRLTMWYGVMALVIEMSGAVLLAFRFVPLLGWGQGVWYSVFHAVSAFCNAGFDLFGDSLVRFQNDPVVILTVSVLIVLGGLGFSVIAECLHMRRWKGLTLHTKLVLIVTGGLLTLGTAFFALVEWDNPETLGGGMNGGSRLMNAWFQSVTMRTAGFNSVNLGALKEASKLMAVILMFVGASPASTGGGVKTTTISVLLLIVLSVIRGQSNVQVMGKRLPADLIRRALAILFISLLIVLGGTMLLTLAENEGQPFLDLLFEATSAFATVGVSSVGTGGLSPASQALLIPLMFFGRVGPLTMALAMGNRMNAGKGHLTYPEEKIMIG